MYIFALFMYFIKLICTSKMKKIDTLFIIWLFLAGAPLLLHAQENDDSRYLEGAVPEVNGRVVFSREFNIPGMSKDEIMSRTHTWMDELMKQNHNNSRIVFTDEENGNIVGSADHYLVFSSSALSLDRTRMIYILTATVKPENLALQLDKIRFIYFEGKEETFTAEEMISDDYALNKDHTKLARGYAKWRRKTVDYVDSLYLSALNMLRVTEDTKRNEAELLSRNNQTVVVTNDEAKRAEPTPVKTTEQPVVVAATVEPKPTVEVQQHAEPQPAEKQETVAPEPQKETPAPNAEPTAPEGYKWAEVSELPTDLITAGNGRLVIAIGSDIYNMTTITAGAGGSLGKQQDKVVVYTILTPEQDASALQKAETYSVRFYPNGADRPSVILDCRKLPAQAAMEGMPQMFAGEVQRALISK